MIEELVELVELVEEDFWLLGMSGVSGVTMVKNTPIIKSRKKNPKAQYVTGEKHSHLKWIHWPHNIIILCDIVIIFLR